ncbi:MAG: type II secretion system protein [Phycisphaerae bacterium]|nr:type II secretion system protein [Phycisphaerae bacterium]
MCLKAKQSGMSLIETVVVVGIAALMVALTMPAVKGLVGSFGSAGGGRSMIGAALASARAMAAKEQKYVGVRFQEDLDGQQYMIFIEQKTNFVTPASPFCVVEGTSPMKLSENISVMDMFAYDPSTTIQVDIGNFGNSDAVRNAAINNDVGLADTTTFSIVFDQAGKLVKKEVRVINRDGQTNNNSEDEIFNTMDNVDSDPAIGKFYQDYHNIYPYRQEYSRREFVIYDKNRFKNTDVDYRCTDYLDELDYCHVNVYTGKLIRAEQ